MKQTICLLLMLLALPSLAVRAQAQADSTRTFSEEHPLIYEDAWDLWPYVFLNENGEPDGYNIDLLKLIFKELDIPYKVKLKPTLEAQADLKNGKSDLMLRMDASFSRGNTLFGRNVVQLFTHSAVYPKGKQISIKKPEDLANYHVIVHEGSFSHHYIMDHGWDKELEAYDDMKDAIQEVSAQGEGVIVWNTMSLKWLMRKFRTENLAIADINLPYGEYKFMSKNHRLLEQMDSVYSALRAADKLQKIQNKWFYPDLKETGIPAWIWKLAVVMAAIAFGGIIYYLSYRYRERKMTKAIRKQNDRLKLILKTSHVTFFTYNVLTKTFSRTNDNGKQEQHLSLLDFARIYRPEDIIKTQETLDDICNQKATEATFDVGTIPTDDNEQAREYTLTLSVLRKSRSGKPIVILCTRSDITEQRLRQQEAKDTMLRYQSIFSNSIIDMAFFDEQGRLTNLNDRACRALRGSREDILAARLNIRDFLGIYDKPLNEFDWFYATQIMIPGQETRYKKFFPLRRKVFYELQVVPVNNASGELLGFFTTGRNVSEVAYSYQQLHDNVLELQKVNDDISEYIRNIDYVLNVGGVRMARYALDTHIMNIYSEINHVEFTLTQTRMFNLVDEQSKRTAQRVLNSMDNHTTNSIDIEIKTVIRKKGGAPLYLQLHFIPEYDKEGRLTSYFGMCRDISEIKAIEQKLAHETLRAQEVEVVKDAFLHNMSFEIRTPLNAVVGFSELFEMEHEPEEETIFIKEIKESSFKLLNLINDILLLSRLDAEMIEVTLAPTDLAQVLAPKCEELWHDLKKPGVRYSVSNPYKKFIAETDFNYISVVLEKVISNAIKYTSKGSIHVRYDYIGDQLIIAVDDTGCGIPEAALDNIFDRFVTGANNGAGLGLSICHEVVRLLGGTINIKSVVGRGTTVWFSIPCKVQEIERV